MNFQEWYKTTRFSNENFFDSYIRYLRQLKLGSKPSESIYGFRLKKIKTTPLMSRLNHTANDESQNIDSLIICTGMVSLVVIYDLPYKYASIAEECGSWTMTELKRSSGFSFSCMNDDRCKRKMHWDNDTWLNVWAIPLQIRAVTNGDKDYRKEYMWGDLVYEGNQYGDTSNFYIIGTLEDKK